MTGSTLVRALVLIAGLVVLGPRGAGAADARCGGEPIAMAAVAVDRSKVPPSARRPMLRFDRGVTAGASAPSGVLLAGIIVPASSGADAGRGLDDALARFDGAVATVYGSGGRLDRRGRIDGQVVAVGRDGRAVWVQAALVGAGLAVVTDNAGGCAEALLDREASARENGLGLFAAKGPAYDAAATDLASADLPDFVLLEGTVVSVGKTDATTYLNFGAEYRTDATVRVGRRISAGFDGDKDLSVLAGIRVRVRGWAFRRDGLDLSLSAPGALEIIGERRVDRRGS